MGKFCLIFLVCFFKLELWKFSCREGLLRWVVEMRERSFFSGLKWGEYDI